MLRHRGRSHLAKVLCHATGAAVKLRLLKRYWPKILLHLLTMILYDFSKLENHVEDKMKQLLSDLSSDVPNSKRTKDV